MTYDWASICQHFPYIAIYENLQSEIDCYGEYETLIGVATKDTKTYTSWENLKNSPHSWKMGGLSYDLKQIFEPNLRVKAPKKEGFPEVCFFVPEIIWKKKRNAKDWEVEGNLSLLENMPLFLPKSLPLSIKFSADFTKENYLGAIRNLQTHIRKGDVYEINLAQRFYAQPIQIESPYLIYKKLTNISPVPFAAFFRFDDLYLLGASPERFLKLDATGKLTSQPIKGTSPRGKNAKEDKISQENLQNSEKERAENIMIVDLTRNDLHRCSEIGSVKVPSLFEIQSFPTLHQMVSTIVGQKAENISAYEVLERCFPPGSMTGAPKFKAMELIADYEPINRNIYAGSIGYFAPDDTFDFNVVIRSLYYNATEKIISYHVGGAITYDSIPEHEYEETLLKAKAIQMLFSW